ncbi:MAG TPA: septum formation inhibitor Maf [Actinobacteria bacterium]|jgi:septum formation protein|nr:septum formation inhibitor Maf [Actinomycetota bacterium]
MPRIVLASQSPARRTVLIQAGVIPEIHVSHVDEEAIEAAMPGASPEDLCLALATAKARAVAASYSDDADALVVGCDSVFDVDGRAFSKASSEAEVRERWSLMLGRSGVLRTGHWVIHPSTGEEAGAVCSTVVHLGRPDQQEQDAYLATGEPLQVAGGFTLDALGGAFVDGIEGDPSNVVGLSLPTLRHLLAGLGVVWTDLWGRP